MSYLSEAALPPNNGTPETKPLTHGFWETAKLQITAAKLKINVEYQVKTQQKCTDSKV